MEKLINRELTNKVIGCFYEVYNALGYGFLEKVYENAMMIELFNQGIYAENQKPIKVKYKNQEVGFYYVDIIVENKLILELKASETLVKENEFQLINYLRASDIELGLLLNFGKKPETKRVIFSNDRKPGKL